MSFSIRFAEPDEWKTVLSILREAADYLARIGQPLWVRDELKEEPVRRDVSQGLYVLAHQNEQAVGTLMFQLEDPEFWPEIEPGSSAYVHRFAVCRSVAGTEISTRMLQWAKSYTRELGRETLRLDCVPRPRLCQIYEAHGFTRHSEKQVGPYKVVRYACRLNTR